MPNPGIRIEISLGEAETKRLQQAAARAALSVEDYTRYAALRLAAQDARLLDRRGSEPAPSRRSLRPRRSDAKMPTHEMVRQLTTHLGVQLLTLTLAADPKSVESWAGESTHPPEPYERRLHAAHEIWLQVSSVESPAAVRAWWMGMKDGLNDLSPAEAIALDRYDDVRAVVRYFMEAG